MSEQDQRVFIPIKSGQPIPNTDWICVAGNEIATNGAVVTFSSVTIKDHDGDSITVWAGSQDSVVVLVKLENEDE